jgi:hypothetical protein
MRALLKTVTWLLVAVAIAFAGYTLGVKRTEYQYSRYQLIQFLWADEIVDSGDTSRFQSGADVFIRGAYSHMQMQPRFITWLAPADGPNREQWITHTAARLHASLERSRIASLSADDVDHFVRTQMASQSKSGMEKDVTYDFNGDEKKDSK